MFWFGFPFSVVFFPQEPFGLSLWLSSRVVCYRTNPLHCHAIPLQDNTTPPMPSAMQPPLAIFFCLVVRKCAYDTLRRNSHTQHTCISRARLAWPVWAIWPSQTGRRAGLFGWVPGGDFDGGGPSSISSQRVDEQMRERARPRAECIKGGEDSGSRSAVMFQNNHQRDSVPDTRPRRRVHWRVPSRMMARKSKSARLARNAASERLRKRKENTEGITVPQATP